MGEGPAVVRDLNELEAALARLRRQLAETTVRVATIGARR